MVSVEIVGKPGITKTFGIWISRSPSTRDYKATEQHNRTGLARLGTHELRAIAQTGLSFVTSIFHKQSRYYS
jgi:hypothetical protein